MLLPMHSGRCYTTEADVIAYYILILLADVIAMYLWQMLSPLDATESKLSMADVIAIYVWQML